MFRSVISTMYVLMGIVLLVSCNSGRVSPSPAANMPNPASVYCEENGGELELRTDASGGVAGICIFPDGSACDEWTYFRGECQPGDNSDQDALTPEANMPNPASVYCEDNGGKLELRTDTSGGVAGFCIFSDGSECDEWTYFRSECMPGNNSGQANGTPEVAGDGWLIYRNDILGYSFEYPADAVIGVNDDPLMSISITGPLVDNENWPQITISHPQDREEYRLPDGADLLQWLTDHNLLGEERMPDVQIAGTTAIHFRHERSSQSYAFDSYYFTRSGQLYNVVIGHVGDKEDWALYDHFLQSIQFIR